ncbi:MAG: hypothetical protein ACFFD4_19025 [Candidatus Odinarchaeota archaeon]
MLVPGTRSCRLKYFLGTRRRWPDKRNTCLINGSTGTFLPVTPFFSPLLVARHLLTRSARTGAGTGTLPPFSSP